MLYINSASFTCTNYQYYHYSNCTLRSFPLPIHDLCRAVGKDGVDTAVTRIQQYIARNHSDERLGIELVARHQERLFATAQQSVSIVL